MQASIAASASRRQWSVTKTDLLWVWIPAVCLLVVLVGGIGVLLLRGQAQARAELIERFEIRTGLATRFVTAYVGDLHAKEAAHARRLLAGREVTPEQFALVSSAFGFDAAVLLDGDGRVLNVLPEKAALLGKPLGRKYAHLRAALAGTPAVSDVVPSAAARVPIVAFAVPFSSRSGRRVFSGGIPISESPLRVFLRSGLPFKAGQSFLVDSSNRVIVSEGPRGAPLPLPSGSAEQGTVEVAGLEYLYASRPVAGTPWRLLSLVPSTELFAPLAGPSMWLPWLVLAAFALAAAIALVLLGKLMRQKDELARHATQDALTGLLNRRSLERAYDRLAFDARRSGSTVGVLTIDLDDFKTVNDVYGHAAGDELLCGIAESLVSAVRPTDVVARVGGDEFVILLGCVSRAEAEDAAGRIVAALEDLHVPALGLIELRARCSVGVTLSDGEAELDAALSRADHAMYGVKAGGKNGWSLARAAG